jgi:flagellar motor switch protein FliG
MDDDTDLLEGDEALPKALALGGPFAAAILLMLLGEEEAAFILRDMDPDDVRQLGKAMFEAAEASEAEVEAALDRFIGRTRQVSSLSVRAEPRIRSVMTQAIGNVRADNVLGDVAPRDSVRALEMLGWMEVSAIAKILTQEHPQVGALIVASLNPEAAVEALKLLSDDQQSDLVMRAARLGAVSSEAISDLEDVLCRFGDVKQSKPKVNLGGKSDAAKIMNKMAKADGERVLKGLKKRDKILGQQIEDEMFIFDNLMDLDDKNLGALMRTVDSAILTLALKGAAEPLVDRMFGCMSARAAQTIRDEMEERGMVKRVEVDEAQRAIIAIARQMANDGTIMLAGAGEDYV